MKLCVLMFFGLPNPNLKLYFENSQQGRLSRPPGGLAKPPCRWGAKSLTIARAKHALWSRRSRPKDTEGKKGTRPKGGYPFLCVKKYQTSKMIFPTFQVSTTCYSYQRSSKQLRNHKILSIEFENFAHLLSLSKIYFMARENLRSEKVDLLNWTR